MIKVITYGTNDIHIVSLSFELMNQIKRDTMFTDMWQ